MSWYGRAGILLFVGVVTGRLIIDGGFGWFVQQRMRYPLAAAAIILLLFGLYELFAAGSRSATTANGDRHGDHDHPDHDHDGEPHDHAYDSDHEHEHAVAEFAEAAAERRELVRTKAGPNIGWLLALPLLVLMSVAPTALGAEAADRVDAYIPTEATNRFSALEPTSEPLEMRVIEFLDRAAWDTERSLEDTVVRLEGLVVNDPAVPDGFKLTRFMVSCCAADGIPLQVTVRNTGTPLENDTWVVADLIWRPPAIPYQEIEGDWTVEADAVQISPIVGVPKDPYESPY